MGNVKLAKLIIDSIALTNNIYFSSNTDKTYSYNDTCKNKVPVSFTLTLNETDFPLLSPLVHADKGNCNRSLYVTHGSSYVNSTSKPVSTRTVAKLVLLWAIINLFYFLLFASLFALVISVLMKLSETVLAVNLLVPSSVVNPLNILLHVNLFVLVMLE